MIKWGMKNSNGIIFFCFYLLAFVYVCCLCLFVCLCVCLFVCLHVCLFVCMFVCFFVQLNVFSFSFSFFCVY